MAITRFDLRNKNTFEVGYRKIIQQSKVGLRKRETTRVRKKMTEIFFVLFFFFFFFFWGGGVGWGEERDSINATMINSCQDV